MFFLFLDSIIEVTQLRTAQPHEIVDDEDDDDVIFVSSASPAVVDLCASPSEPVDEIPDVQVVNFLLDHTQPPPSTFSSRNGRTPRSVGPMVHLMAQQMEEAVATSAALAALAGAKRAAETAAAEAAATAAATAAAAAADSLSKRARFSAPQITCSVCLEYPFDNRPNATVCGHVFCEGCIQMAIKQCRKCPMCNRKLTIRQVHPLYV